MHERKKKPSTIVDFETASAIRKAAASCLSRVTNTRVLPPSDVAQQIIRSIIHRDHGSHECREDFLIFVEQNLWSREFDEETKDLNEIEKGEIRLAIRAYFNGRNSDER